MIGNNRVYVLIFFLSFDTPIFINNKPSNIFRMFMRKPNILAIILDSFVMQWMLCSLKQIKLTLMNLIHTLTRELRVENNIFFVMWTHSYWYNTPYVSSLNEPRTWKMPKYFRINSFPRVWYFLVTVNHVYLPSFVVFFSTMVLNLWILVTYQLRRPLIDKYECIMYMYIYI